VLISEIREMFSEQYDARELIFQMVRRDLVLRYKQTVMGFAWAIFTPLINTIVFSVVFMRIAPLDVGVPYPMFAYCGLLVWNLTAGALRSAVLSLTSNITLVTKVYFPREVFPISSVIVSAVDSLVGSVVLIGMMIYYHVTPTPALLFLPVIIAVQLILTSAVAMALAMANLFYRDVKYLFEVVITVFMFLTSVLYPLDQLTGKTGMVVHLNPMSHIVNAYRLVLLQGTVPPLGTFAWVTAISITAFSVAWLAFHRAEYLFAENA
jgi:lipopolysaccharide transport system permease protein